MQGLCFSWELFPAMLYGCTVWPAFYSVAAFAFCGQIHCSFEALRERTGRFYDNCSIRRWRLRFSQRVSYLCFLVLVSSYIYIDLLGRVGAMCSSAKFDTLS